MQLSFKTNLTNPFTVDMGTWIPSEPRKDRRLRPDADQVILLVCRQAKENISANTIFDDCLCAIAFAFFSKLYQRQFHTVIFEERTPKYFNVPEIFLALGHGINPPEIAFCVT